MKQPDNRIPMTMDAIAKNPSGGRCPREIMERIGATTIDDINLAHMAYDAELHALSSTDEYVAALRNDLQRARAIRNQLRGGPNARHCKLKSKRRKLNKQQRASRRRNRRR